jgi:hypothetical protein
VLFRGLDHKEIKYDPVLNMAAEYFTHLGVDSRIPARCSCLVITNVAAMNPECGKSGENTLRLPLETEELLE